MRTFGEPGEERFGGTAVDGSGGLSRGEQRIVRLTERDQAGSGVEDDQISRRAGGAIENLADQRGAGSRVFDRQAVERLAGNAEVFGRPGEVARRLSRSSPTKQRRG